MDAPTITFVTASTALDSAVVVPRRSSLSEAVVQRSAYWTDESRANWMPLRQLELQRAKLLDRAHDFIAGLQPHLLLFGISENDALRCPRPNDVTGLKRPHLGNVGDQLWGAEDHAAGIRRLTLLPIYMSLNLQVVGCRRGRPPTQSKAQSGRSYLAYCRSSIERSGFPSADRVRRNRVKCNSLQHNSERRLQIRCGLSFK